MLEVCNSRSWQICWFLTVYPTELFSQWPHFLEFLSNGWKVSPWGAVLTSPLNHNNNNNNNILRYASTKKVSSALTHEGDAETRLWKKNVGKRGNKFPPITKIVESAAGWRRPAERNPQIPPEPRSGPPLVFCEFVTWKSQIYVSDLSGFEESGEVKNHVPPEIPEFVKL